MPRPTAEVNAAGHDSFLDVVSNIVGILVILVMVVGLRVKNAPVEARPDQAFEIQAAALAKDQATVKSLREDTLALQRRIEAVEQESFIRFQQRDRLAVLVTALERDLRAAREKLDAGAREAFDLGRELSEARARLDSLRQELSRAEAADAEPVVVESYPTPLSETVEGDEIHFQLRDGRVAFIPLDRLIDRFKAEAKQKIYKLRELPEVTDTVGPDGGFRFRYTLARRPATLEEQLEAGAIQIGLTKWSLLPISNDLGESVDAALAQGSQFRRVLAGHRPETTAVTIWVYPDSFAHFRRLKKELHQLGFATAGRPLPDGVLISGSPEGTKSAAE